MPDVNDVKETLEETKKLRDYYKEKSDKDCRCELNANDHKGPCNYCQGFGFFSAILNKGALILEMDAIEFHIEAELWLKEARSALLKDSFYAFLYGRSNSMK